MITLVIEVEEGRELLRLVGERLSDLTAPFTKMGEAALEDARAQIDSQGQAFGGSFADMSPLTTIVATKLYGRGRDPRTLLKDQGGLVASLTPGGAANVLEAGETTLVAGSSYRSKRTGFQIAKYQQEGTHRTFHVLEGSGFSEGVGIPGRDVLAWRPERFEEFQVLLAEHVMGADAA